MSYTLTIIARRFLEDDIVDGDVTSSREDVDTLTDLTPADIVREIRARGLTFGATGGEWAADPDGSRTVDYATGEREEISAHLADDIPADVAGDIVAAVEDVGTVATFGLVGTGLPPYTLAVRVPSMPAPGWRMASRRAAALVADVAPMALRRIGPDAFYCGRAYAFTFFRA